MAPLSSNDNNDENQGDFSDDSGPFYDSGEENSNHSESSSEENNEDSEVEATEREILKNLKLKRKRDEESQFIDEVIEFIDRCIELSAGGDQCTSYPSQSRWQKYHSKSEWTNMMQWLTKNQYVERANIRALARCRAPYKNLGEVRASLVELKKDPNGSGGRSNDSSSGNGNNKSRPEKKPRGRPRKNRQQQQQQQRKESSASASVSSSSSSDDEADEAQQILPPPPPPPSPPAKIIQIASPNNCTFNIFGGSKRQPMLTRAV